MLRTIHKRIITVLVSLSMLAVPALIPVTVSADAAPPPATPTAPNLQNDLGCGATFTTTPSSTCATSTATGAGKVQGVVTTIVDYFSIIVGLLAVIMLIFGGLKYITSGGDSSKAASARTAIVSAVIGLVIVALAQVVVQFVLTKANPDAKTTGTSGASTPPAGN